MRQDDNNRWVSDDGHWMWDGSAWQPVTSPPGEEPSQVAPVPPGSADAASPDAASVDPSPAGVPSRVREPDATHPLSPDGTLIWDGHCWVAHKPVTNAPTPPAPPNDHPLSPDGHWQWDGSAWQPVDTPGGPACVDTRQLSPDGRWVWDGTSWKAVETAVAATPAAGATDAAAQALVASGMAVSADGNWVWNGKAWQPTRR